MNARLLVPALALAAISATGAALASASPLSPQPPYPQQYQHDDGWDRAPAEFRDVQRQGFHDGIEAARRDFYQGRRPDPDQHREFRQPSVPPPVANDYREGFRRGYETAMHHMREGDHDRDRDYDYRPH